MNQRLIAIWTCKNHVLLYNAGEIEEFKENGLVKIKGIPLALVKPLKILPYDEKYLKKLKELDTFYMKRSKEIDIAYQKEKQNLVNICNQEFETFLEGN